MNSESAPASRNLRCFGCKTSFNGDPRQSMLPDSSCPTCGATPLLFEVEDGYLTDPT